MKSSQLVLQTMKELKIKVHEPFAAYLGASNEETDFEISLLDCYRFAGHACHSVTGAFLCVKAALETFSPANPVCSRGDLRVDFGSRLGEKATGPRSNVISFITGAWGETGFGGLKGDFSRSNLVRYGDCSLKEDEVRFQSRLHNKSVIVRYSPGDLISNLHHGLDFPASWRFEILSIIEAPSKAIFVEIDA